MDGTGVSPHLVAGYVSGLLTVLLCAPLDTIRNRLQVERFCEQRITETSLMRIARNTVKEEGIAGLYRGLSLTLVALPVSQGTYFYVYAECRKRLKAWGLGELWTNVYSAGLASCANNVLTNPLWLARTRVMSQQLHRSNRYRGVFQTIRLIAQEEGVSALYQGVSASMIGIYHVMVQFPLYELLKAQRHSVGPPSYLEMLYLSLGPKLVASLVSYPHEVLRSRLQDLNKQHTKSEFRGLLSLVRVTWVSEGLRGFYAGYRVALIRTIPATYVTLTAYERVLYMME